LRGVRFLLEPALLFLEATGHARTADQIVPALDADQNVSPIVSKFYLSKEGTNYYPHVSTKREIAGIVTHFSELPDRRTTPRDKISVGKLTCEPPIEERPGQDSYEKLRVHQVKASRQVYNKKHVDPLVQNQLTYPPEEIITCVVSLGLGESFYPTQLDSGAVPNVISEETANLLRKKHADEIDYINLDNPVHCTLADDKEIQTADYVIVPKLKFGKHELKIPFYVLPGCNQTFIIGTRTMDLLKIKPEISERVAYCQPTSEHSKEMLRYLKPHEYEDSLIINKIRLDISLEPEVAKILNRANLARKYRRLPEGIEDDGPTVFIQRLQEDLKLAVEKKQITQAECDYAFAVLSQFKDIFSRFPGRYVGEKVKFEFNIPLEEIEYRGAKYNPAKSLMDRIRQELLIMLALGIIEPSNSRYINPIVANLKKTGELRICINPVDLNPILEVNYNEAGLLDRIITDDPDARFFSSLDFVSGFWQLVLDESCQKYCAFQVDGRVYHFTRLPYGLKISSAEFVNLVNKVIPDDDGISKYVDDILLRSKTFKEMLALIEKIFKLLRKYGLKLNAHKTTFFRDSTNHLGFVLKHREICKDSKKLDKFMAYKLSHIRNGKFELRNDKEILQVIGLTVLYRRFIKNYQQILAPLYELVNKKGPDFVWGPRQDEALALLEQEYTKEFTLQPALNGLDLYLDTYTSHDASNGVLYQIVDGKEQIVMFASHCFKEHQKEYTIVEKEMYTLTKLLRKLKLWLIGRKIHVRRDLEAIVEKFR
ncbi:unnamed protein product, partial [Allacma fusca]